jgi:ribonucleoside-diphosphate reductase subunit M2
VFPITAPPLQIHFISHNFYDVNFFMAATFESPSKRATSSLQDMSLDSPKKARAPSPTLGPLDKFIAEYSNDDEDDVVTAKPAAPQQDSIDDLRTRFVGEVDLDEKDEPLLKESSRRFVLFPIQYHEVRARFIFARRVFLVMFH